MRTPRVCAFCTRDTPPSRIGGRGRGGQGTFVRRTNGGESAGCSQGAAADHQEVRKTHRRCSSRTPRDKQPRLHLSPEGRRKSFIRSSSRELVENPPDKVPQLRPGERQFSFYKGCLKGNVKLPLLRAELVAHCAEKVTTLVPRKKREGEEEDREGLAECSPCKPRRRRRASRSEGSSSNQKERH